MSFALCYIWFGRSSSTEPFWSFICALQHLGLGAWFDLVAGSCHIAIVCLTCRLNIQASAKTAKIIHDRDVCAHLVGAMLESLLRVVDCWFC